MLKARKFSISLLLCISFAVITATACAQKANPAKPLPPLSVGKNDTLIYQRDSLGNQIIDFSFCGYRAGETTIPNGTAGMFVPLKPGDNTRRIQQAIDYISKQPPGSNGLRGVVYLEKGTYTIEGSLHLHTSGVVIRGTGPGQDGTVLLGAGKDRATLICIEGIDDRAITAPLTIKDDYVPVSATVVTLDEHHPVKAGDQVIITRPSPKEWIDAIGTAHFGGGITSLGWKPGQRNLEWRRKVLAVNGTSVTIDVPITTAMEKEYGGGTLATYTWPGIVKNCGIENIRLVSSYDASNLKDEDHRWMAITINNAEDCWVRQASFYHFAGSAVAIYENASRVTVEDCISKQPVSEIGGERRHTFFTTGQQVLFQRCYSEYGMHDFSTGFCAPGPNAFVQCESYRSYNFSGGIDSWSSGTLFDAVNIDGNAISFFNRGQDGQGAGWAMANSVLWNCSAARIDCYKPPGANNWSFGSWAQFAGDGYWAESNNNIEPRSLYYAQLKARLGLADKDPRIQLMYIETDASSSPTVEQAALLTKLAASPAKTLLAYIENASARQLIPARPNLLPSFDELATSKAMSKTPSPLRIQDARLLIGDVLVTGGRWNTPWWNGTVRPYAVKNATAAITRFVPGRMGKGLTDELRAMTDSMQAKNIVVFEQNYGLWYDRRRDDHQRVRRMDGDVWAPFYELPFARSGKDTAWDGLSKYDLTKYNYWYWNRLKTFATLAAEKGLVLVHQNYFQHNILEAGAHYADFPWRTANNINNTGFPEPVPYAGDKRIFMDEYFYDTAHPVRRTLHKKYIRQCLDNFRDQPNVIQFIGEEFTGPLHFVQFWLNTIREWQAQTGINPLIGLSVTKDVQDAILSDGRYASLIDIIDIRYWHYQADGTPYAPKGGQHLAPRQHARLLKPRSASAESVYAAVSEYRKKFPGKAVMYSGDNSGRFGWAVLMAGGSLPAIRINEPALLKAISTMQPVATPANSKQWILSGKNNYVICDRGDDLQFSIDVPLYDAGYDVVWINMNNGEIKNSGEVIRGKGISLTKPGNDWAVWLRKKSIARL